MGHCPGTRSHSHYRGTRPTVVSRNKHVTCKVHRSYSRGLLDKARFARGTEGNVPVKGGAQVPEWYRWSLRGVVGGLQKVG